MATDLRQDPELAAIVERARKRAEETGELPRRSRAVPESTLPEEARDVIRAWLRDGGYEEAIARIAAEDPDLANE